MKTDFLNMKQNGTIIQSLCHASLPMQRVTKYYGHLFFPQASYLLQDDPLGLDSCWASSRIFSMSPLWMEEDEGTCSSPPTRLSPTSFTACRDCGGSVSPWFLLATEAARLGISCCLPDAMFPFNSNSTQDPGEPTKLSIVMLPLTLKFTEF